MDITFTTARRAPGESPRRVIVTTKFEVRNNAPLQVEAN